MSDDMRPSRMPAEGPGHPSVQPDGRLPPYRQIAAWVTAQITAGRILPGDRIWSEKDLTEMFEVARTTVRRAVRYLREEGLIETEPGRGSYVAGPAPGCR